MNGMAGGQDKGFAPTFQGKNLLQILVVGDMSVVDQGYDLRVWAAGMALDAIMSR